MIRRVLIAVMAVALFGFGPVRAQPSTPPTATAAKQASLDQAKAADENGDFATGLSIWRSLAEQGVAEAQFIVGHRYKGGVGVKKDYAAAVFWYRKAADQGNAEAQGMLGSMCEYGWGVPRDYAQAVSWYRKAAEQGDVDAQAGLGMMYWGGTGVPQDYVQAHKWFNLAASGRVGSFNSLAAESRDKVAALMTPAQIDEAQKLANAFQARPTPDQPTTSAPPPQPATAQSTGPEFDSGSVVALVVLGAVICAALALVVISVRRQKF